MTSFFRSRRRGFTLIELVIVLGVVGVMGVGLYRLISNGSQQVRDQNTASQQGQIISAVKSYLATQEGTTLLTGLAAGGTNALSLPTSNTSVANCQANIAANPGLCNYLPTGFINTTTNAYGQVYKIYLMKDSTPAGTTPNSYSFLIESNGGQVIPDTSGGRISSLIGGDGGFVYTTSVCGAPATKFSCGSYGAWSVDVTSFGGVAGSGVVASRTFVSSALESTYYWLARSLVAGDSTVPPTYNTMTTNFYGGGQNIFMGKSADTTPNPLFTGTATGGGSIYLQNGNALLYGTDVEITASDPNANIYFNYQGVKPNYNTLRIEDTCSELDAAPCHTPAILVNDGDISVTSGEVKATKLLSVSDIRLKKDISPIQNALDKVMELKPVNFVLRQGNKPSLGLISQDLEKVYPQLVSDENGTKYINYDGLFGPVIGGVQDLKRENDDLRAQLKAQSDRIDRLEKQINTGK